MTDLVSADQIETIVGTRRRLTQHVARAVSAEETVYILHSRECLETGVDLRTCRYSLALDEGIRVEGWTQDTPLIVIVAADGTLCPRRPRRIQMRRTKGWHKPADAIYVGRPSKWGNPYRPDDYREDWPDADEPDRRRMAVSDFRYLVLGRFETLDDTPSHVTIDEIRAELRGYDLACWCPFDSPCHADVLLELANA